jgi:serine/threonine-protein kinase PknK
MNGVVGLSTELTVLGHEVALATPLGRGATGDVWLARGEGTVAYVLKFARDRAASARLLEEGERLLGVDSPWCARLLAVGKLDAGAASASGLGKGSFERGVPYLVLEHHAGEPLVFHGLDAGARRRRALVVARDIGRALVDLHGSGVAHGDVKPDNILLEAGERARLVDFGLAGLATEAIASGGTRRYLAPEVLEAPGSSDARLRDLYALGVSLAEIAGGSVAPGEAPAAGLAVLDIELAALIQSLLSLAPAARPSADWVLRRALTLLGEAESEAEQRERRQSLIRRTYLARRRRELVAAARRLEARIEVAGVPGGWLAESWTLMRALEELRGSAAAETGPGVLADLDAVGRARWLVELVGPSAAAWPDLRVGSDDELVRKLSSAVLEREPRQLVFRDLERPEPVLRLDRIELALQLGRGAPSAGVLDQAESLIHGEGAPAALGLALGRALRLRGEFGRALAVLARVDSPLSSIEAAEVLRRAGDRAGAEAQVAAAEANGISSPRLTAVKARLLLDAGNAARAFELVRDASDVPGLEVCALAEIALGQRRGAAASIERAALVAESDEDRARLSALSGNLEHFAGNAESALAHFRRAAEHAAHAGAVLEEATYLTGVAAEAANVGELLLALEAGLRAVLLFEGVGRQREAARALLSLASAHASIGARAQAREHAEAALRRARAAGDERCRGYAHLVLSDVSEPGDREGLEHVRFAASLLDQDRDDRLRVAARLHERGDALDVLDVLDAESSSSERALDVRLEWWAARARVAVSGEAAYEPARVLDALLSLASERAPIALRGPAAFAGAELAAKVGDGDAVRRLTLIAAEAARQLFAHAGPALSAQVRGLSWVRVGDSSGGSGFSAEQLADVDRLVRALGRRDRLRPLLEQIVDALVLWTGVERGLLLLRAPGGRLRPRAGRNLLRADLTGAQLSLSHSLAERALAQGEPVVAVDASGDLPDVHESVHALKLRSVLAVPLLARGEALGVVYLDDRVRRGAFGPRELAWVRLVATLAAVAIADARDQISLRRAARRAERAEGRLAIELAQREARLDVAERELARAREARETRHRYDEIIGQSEAVRSMLKLVDRVASSEVPVMLVGESGSGKELVARAVHRHGSRSGEAFVAENCGAIPETLLETTLFGHVRGAFTGASRPRAGLFEVADKGTLFLDEIGEMSLGMQAKLLRALQDGEIRPVGSDRARKVDVRVITATHRDLAAMVASSKFREDLYYRLNVISVKIPSLRERVGDVPLLVKHFVDLHAGKRRVQVSKAAMDRLAAYSWPGNVRQLENEVRRALVLADELILPELLTPEVSGSGDTRPVDELNLRRRLDALEVELVTIALRRTEGNQTRAAELLGLSRFGLQKMMKRLDISFQPSLS